MAHATNGGLMHTNLRLDAIRRSPERMLPAGDALQVLRWRFVIGVGSRKHDSTIDNSQKARTPLLRYFQ
jgi:hypothetical protein